MTVEDAVKGVNIRWGVGIAVTIILFVAGALWSVSSEAGARRADIRVLEARADASDSANLNIASSVRQLTEGFTQMRMSQIEFQTQVKNELERLKEDVRSTRALCPAGGGGSSPPGGLPY